MAEAILRHRLEEAGVEASVSSAGLHAGGRPATTAGVAAMAARGLDTSGHVSRQLEAEMVAAADLIVGMAREHVREVAVIDPGALARSFTLKELVRLGEQAGPRAPDEPLEAWLARLGRGRERQRLLGAGHDPDYDVEDPVGRGRDDYEATAAELDDLLGRLAALALAPTAKEPTT